MSRNSRRLRSLALMVVAVFVANIAISYASGVPIMPDMPKPKSGVPIMPDMPRP